MLAAPLESTGGFYSLGFEAMGTRNRVLFCCGSRARAMEFRGNTLEWLADFEDTYSVFREGSLVSEINRSAGKQWVSVDCATEKLFSVCDWLHWRTGGIVDATAAPLLDLWDFRKCQKGLPDADSVERARELVGWRRVERRSGAVRLPREGMCLDLGGIGKEYALDHVAAMAIDFGMRGACLDFGNDLRVFGSPPQGGAWRLGLEHPVQEGQCWGGVALERGALCCSGHYRRYFECDGRRYSHIIDPRSGYPVRNGCVAAWVLAPSAIEAGALATASLVLGVDDGLRMTEQNVQASACIWQEGRLHQTRRFADHVEYEKSASAS